MAAEGHLKFDCRRHPAGLVSAHAASRAYERGVVIPASAVTRVEDGIWLNLTKEQVEDLPPTADSR